MFTKAALRRPLAASVAILLGAAALVAAPLAVSTADATTVSGNDAVMSILDSTREGSSLADFKSNGYLNDYAQALAVNVASCDGCYTPVTPKLSADLPSQSTFHSVSLKIAGGATSGRPARAGNDFVNTYLSIVVGSTPYASVGYYTKGSSSYVTLVVATFDSTPLEKIIPGKVTLPSTIKVGTPINPVITGFSPVPSGQYGYTFIDATTSATLSTAFNYAPTSAQIGHKIRVIISDSISGYVTASATSADSHAVVIGTVTVGTGWNVVGARNVGEPLSVNEGSGWKPTAPTFQWYRNGSKITGATNSSYTQSAADYGKKIDVKLTVAQFGYVTKTVGTSDKVTTGHPLLSATPFPTITGSPSYGQNLTANTGDWGPGTVTLKYQWLANGSPIKGATSNVFKLGTAQLFSSISVEVTGSESGYASTSKVSEATTDITPLVFSEVADPTIVGSPTAGSTLKATVGAWTPTATKYTYQWYLYSNPISGAHSSSYKLPKADIGQEVSVQIVGSRTDYASYRVASTPVTVTAP